MRIKIKYRLSIGLSIICVFLSSHLNAQENTVKYDSTFLFPPKSGAVLQGGYLKPATPDIQQLSNGRLPLTPFVLPPTLAVKPITWDDNYGGYHPKTIDMDRSRFLNGEYTVSGPILQWRRDMLYGSGAQRNMIGMGTMNTATLGYQHLFGDKLLIDISLNAVKYSVPHFTNISYGASGRISYMLSKKTMLNVFGGYNKTLARNSYNYGASMSFDMGDYFGVEMGVNRFYDPYANRWKTSPIVAPYVKIHGQKAFQFDIGGLLKGIYDSKHYKPSPVEIKMQQAQQQAAIKQQRAVQLEETKARWGERRMPGMP